MKYLQHTEIKSIQEQYDHIIGWGTGPIFKMNYRRDYFDFEFLVDGTGKILALNLRGEKLGEKLQEIYGF